MFDFDVAIIGGGISGMTTALLLANSGKRVVLCESHTCLGGCAGYFRRGDFSFDVGATTFISFQPGGVGWQLAQLTGMSSLNLEKIQTYTLCLPDRKVPISSDQWTKSWAQSFPELGRQGEAFFEQLGRAADKIWSISCRFPSLPLQSVRDLTRSLAALRPQEISVFPHFFSNFSDYLSGFGELPIALQGAFNMLLQDTTQNDIVKTPTAYALLGLTLMRHGLYRPIGSTARLWSQWGARIESLGGELRLKHKVTSVEQQGGGFQLNFQRERRSAVTAKKLVSALPVWNTHRIAPQLFRGRLDPYLERRESLDGAFALYLGVKDIGFPDDSLHYQVLSDFHSPLDDGNNFLISISGPGEGAAPAGYRSVTISCHTEPTRWEEATLEQQKSYGEPIVERFLSGAEALFPGFRAAIVAKHFYPASPLTYRRFTNRYRGMAGYQGLTTDNCIWKAIPRSFGTENFWQVGDTVFPGAGTVACMVSGFNAYKDIEGHWF